MDTTIRQSVTQSYIDLENEFGAQNYKPLDVVLARGQGVWVWDVEGNKYLDMLASYSALNQGHCHPRILNALIEQAKKLTLVSRAFRTDQLGAFYKEICEMTHSHSVLPMNSGAEAVETALNATGSAPSHPALYRSLSAMPKLWNGPSPQTPLPS
jgi:ornithine--oxo-acid transaminase